MACRRRIPAFVTLAKTIRANRNRILAAVKLGLSISKLEGINSRIRLINHRGYGHHSAAALIAMIYLCCSGITVKLPTEKVRSPSISPLRAQTAAVLQSTSHQGQKRLPRSSPA